MIFAELACVTVPIQSQQYESDDMVVLQTGFPYNIATAKCIKEAPKIKIKNNWD